MRESNAKKECVCEREKECERIYKKCRKGKIENCSSFWLSASNLSQHNKSFRIFQKEEERERERERKGKRERNRGVVRVCVCLSM